MQRKVTFRLASLWQVEIGEGPVIRLSDDRGQKTTAKAVRPLDEGSPIRRKTNRSPLCLAKSLSELY